LDKDWWVPGRLWLLWTVRSLRYGPETRTAASTRRGSPGGPRGEGTRRPKILHGRSVAAGSGGSTVHPSPRGDSRGESSRPGSMTHSRHAHNFAGTPTEGCWSGRL